MRRVWRAGLALGGLGAFVAGVPAAAAPQVDPSCACGDADGSEVIDTGDVLHVREKLVGLIADVAAPGKCQVASGGGCGLLDAVVIARDLASQPPSIQQECSVAATPVCQDASSDVLDAVNAAAMLPQGPDVIGGIGDFALTNGRLRAVIDAPGFDPTSLGGTFPLANLGAPTGGNLVDLASAATGNDQWVQQTQAVVGRDSVATGSTGVANAANDTFVDASADFVSDGVVATDVLSLTTGANSGLELMVASVLDPTTLLLVVPPGTPYLDDLSGSIVYAVQRETSALSNVVVYDAAELLDDQGLPVSSHSGDAVRLRLSGGVRVLDPLDLPDGTHTDPATGRLSSGGSTLEVETIYTLLAGSRALEVETRLTNPSDGGAASIFALRDVVRIGGLQGEGAGSWSTLAGSLPQGLFVSLPMPFAGVVGRAEPGASYAVVDVEAGQLFQAATTSLLVHSQLADPGSLPPGASFTWRRAIAVGESNDAGSAAGEAVRRLAASTERLTPGGTTVPNPYRAAATLTGTVSGASDRTRVVAYEAGPGLVFDPGVPSGITAAAGFYPSWIYALPAPPIAFATPDPTTGDFSLTVPSGFPGLVGSGPDELVVPLGFEGGVAGSVYRVEVEHPGLDPLSQFVPVTDGGSAQVDFTLEMDASLARFDIAVTDGFGGALPARVVVRGVDPDGAGPIPATPDPDFGDLPRASGRRNVVHLVDGVGSVHVPPGAYQVLASRGLEYGLDRVPAPGSSPDFIWVAAGQVVNASLSLERLLDSTLLPDPMMGTFSSPLRRLVSAELRVHSASSYDAGVPAEDQVAGHLANGVEVLVAGDEDMLTELGPAIASLDAAHAIDVPSLVTHQTGVSTSGGTPVNALVALELPNTLGSFGAWPLAPDPDARRRGAPPDEYRQPAALFDQLRAAGASVVAIHTPRYPIPDLPLPAVGRGFFTNGKQGFPQPNRGGASLVAGGYATPVQSSDGSLSDLVASQTAAGTSNADFDAMEIDAGWTLLYDLQRLDWSALTSAGLVRTALASSGARDLVQASGFPRSFVFAPGDASSDLSSLSLAAFDAALLPRLVQPTRGINLPAQLRVGAGPDDMEVLGSSGPVVYLEVDADEDGVFEGQPGDMVVDDMDGSIDVRLTVLAAPWVPVDGAWIRRNGGGGGLPTGLSGLVYDRTVSLASNPGNPFATDLDDVVRLREVLTLPLPGDAWFAADARGVPASGGEYQAVVSPGGSATLTEAVGFTNPVFVDADGNGQFDPPGVP